MKNIYKRLRKFIPLLWTIIIIWIVVLLIFVQSNIEYQHKITTILSNKILIIIGVTFLIILSCIYSKFKDKIDKFINNLSNKTIIYFSIILFIIQSFIFFKIYFLSGWDCEIIVDSVLSLIENNSFGIYKSYYFMYPNNLLLTWIYSKIFILSDILEFGKHLPFLVILIQSLLSCFAGYMLFSIVKNISKKTYAYFVWFIYVIHIALSPWISILYSDGLTLIFPILIIWIYQKLRNNKYDVIKLLLIGFITYIGFKLKPTIVITTIAIFLFEILEFLKNINRKEVLKKVKFSTSILIGIILAHLLYTTIIIPALPIDVDNKKSMNVYHYFMMGLNTETDGAYNKSDVYYSFSQGNNPVGNKNKIDKSINRLKEMELNGFISHINKKMLVTYGDGTYAWGQEGQFFGEPLAKSDGISNLLRSFYYEEKDNYKYFVTFEHLIWLTILVSSCGVILYLKNNKKENKVIYIIILSLIGITLYQILFEVRARYLFIYSPFYLIIALFGWIGFYNTFLSLKKKIQKLN